MFYEALIADPEPEIRSLIEFCGLPWDSACLEHQHTENPVFTASDWQVRQPLYRSSSMRWHHYRDQLDPAVRILEAEINEYESDLKTHQQRVQCLR